VTATPNETPAAILVAAGSSRRMGSDKVWIDLFGRPVWRWSFDVLATAVPSASLVVVVPPGAEDRFRSALPPGSEAARVVGGGATRADSVRAGIVALTEAGCDPQTPTLVQDAARPALDRALLDRVLAAAATARAVIPVIAVSDTVKEVGAGVVRGTVAREGLMLAQTPQLARLGDLRAALDPGVEEIDPTDEAAALEHLGVQVTAVPGDAANRKLTDPADLAFLRATLAARSSPLVPPEIRAGQRAGIGFDAHRLADRVPLRLGGLAFPDEARGLAGHSDGDVVLHAIIDALLGAAGRGDVGSRFPQEATPPGADSGALLGTVLGELAASGWAPALIDVAIAAAGPAIAPVRDRMAATVAALVGVQPAAVSIRGTTSDGLGFTGSEGIAAWALAVVNPA
jgi:2-C-methyl-D-erythritol 4-phosphate cytidylyltransferase/2-C-methyl-D-erythritol 2,4-cyclodiphosphate synthase